MKNEMQLSKIDELMKNDKIIEMESKEYKQIIFLYETALKELNTKLENIKNQYKVFYEYDLIDHINTRIKSKTSITKKMQDKGLNYTYKDMVRNINDIAGIRVICPLKEDIYSIRRIITKISDIKILKEKDYVKNPKKSGYSSYHMILAVPVMLFENNIYVKVEIQIRTLAMDFWASIEHTIKYKTNKKISEESSKKLVKYAKVVDKLDENIMLLQS